MRVSAGPPTTIEDIWAKHMDDDKGGDRSVKWVKLNRKQHLQIARQIEEMEFHLVEPPVIESSDGPMRQIRIGDSGFGVIMSWKGKPPERWSKVAGLFKHIEDLVLSRC